MQTSTFWHKFGSLNPADANRIHTKNPSVGDIKSLKSSDTTASKIGLPAPCCGDVALRYAKPGSSVNSSTGPWAPTGEERAVVLATLPKARREGYPEERGCHVRLRPL